MCNISFDWDVLPFAPKLMMKDDVYELHSKYLEFQCSNVQDLELMEVDGFDCMMDKTSDDSFSITCDVSNQLFCEYF